MVSFGKALMREHFLLDSSKAFINHGSFGTVHRKVYQQKLKLQEQKEQQPDIWFRKITSELWNDNLNEVAEFLGANPDNLVFVSNATTGINAVARSLKWREGDAILISQYTYGAVKNMCHYLAQLFGFEVIIVEHSFPLNSAQEIVDAFEQALSKHRNVKLAIIDHISSVPTMLMPVKDLITVCRRHNTPILIDGAHAPGQIDLNLEDLGADFYTGNLHKWAYASRGCAVLWVHPKYHRIIHPPVTSIYNTKDWKDNFSYQGTRDDTTFYTAAMAVRCYREIGGYAVISRYNTRLVAQAADLLVEKWGTEHYPLPEEMKTPNMRMVRLPQLGAYTEHDGKPAYKHNAIDLNPLMFVLWERFGVQTVCLEVDGVAWVRLSANVYNCINDYRRLADAVLTIKAEQFLKSRL